jgi:hypothetical protein
LASAVRVPSATGVECSVAVTDEFGCQSGDVTLKLPPGATCEGLVDPEGAIVVVVVAGAVVLVVVVVVVDAAVVEVGAAVVEVVVELVVVELVVVELVEVELVELVDEVDDDDVLPEPA